MIVYYIGPKPDSNFGSFEVADEWDFNERCKRHVGNLKIISWTPPQLKCVKRRKDKLPDYSEVTSFSPIFSQRAVDSLRDILERDGTLLPAKCDAGEYYIFITHKALDAIDYPKSEYTLDQEGDVKEIETHVFEVAKLCGTAIFRHKRVFKPGHTKLIDVSINPAIWATDEFVRRFEEAGLTGLYYEVLWSSDAKAENAVKQKHEKLQRIAEKRKQIAAKSGSVFELPKATITLDEDSAPPSEEDFVRLVWEEFINRAMTGSWIDEIFDGAASETPAEVTRLSAEALERLFKAGASRTDLCYVARSLYADGAYMMLQRLFNPGVASDDTDDSEPDYLTLSQLILEGGPPDSEGRPGGWPVDPDYEN